MDRDDFVINVETPFGPFGVEGRGRVITAIYLPNEGRPSSPGAAPKVALGCARQLEEYFAGTRRRFRVALEPRVGTDFQHDVYQAIAAIPYGQVRTYGEVAAIVAHPLAHRAVGSVCNANHYPILIPCHRVVAAGGLGGYGGAGVELKRQLLELEGVHY